MKNKKQIRNHFRNSVFERDKNCCKVCGQKSEILDAHHITDRNELPFGGYVLENGISLCPDCHWKAEAYHRSQHQSYELGYHPNDLYNLIDSSKEKAKLACLKLEKLMHS